MTNSSATKPGRRPSWGLLSTPLGAWSSFLTGGIGGGSSGYRPLLIILVTLLAVVGLLSGLHAPTPTSEGLVPHRPDPESEGLVVQKRQQEGPNGQQPEQATSGDGPAALDRDSLKLQQDSPVFAVVGGVPVAFQGPSTVSESAGLKGVFVLLHGCTHTEADWFSLPEERRIVSLLRSRGYATLALKSRGVCWDSETQHTDLQPVAAAVSSLVTLWSPSRRLLPLYCFGASSGGTFAMVLPRALPLSGVVVQISPGTTMGIDRWKQASQGSLAPVAMVYMPKDGQWASEEAVSETAAALRSQGHAVTLLPCGGDLTFNEDWFFERGAVVSEDESRALVEALVAEGDVLCGEQAKAEGLDKVKSQGRCVLRRDPRASGVYGRLERRGGVMVRLMADERRSVEEGMNVLWGMHELTSERVEEWLDFVTAGQRRL